MAVTSGPDFVFTKDAAGRGVVPAAHIAQQLLSDASVALTASLDLRETIDRVARILVPSLADWCIIDLVEDDGSERTVRRAAAVHADTGAQATLDEMSRRFPPRADHPTLSKSVIETGAPVLVAEVPDEMIDRFVGPEQAALVRQIGVRSYMVVPLCARDRLLGVMALFSSSRSYRRADLTLAEELARRIAISIDNARLFTQVRESAARLERLQTITAVLARAVTAEQVAEIVIREAVEALHASEGMLCLTTEDGAWLEIVREVGLPDSTVRDWHRFPVSGQLPLSEAVRTGEAVFFENRAALVTRYPELRDANSRAVARAWMALPLISNGVAIGGLAFGFANPRSFQPEDRAFSRTLAQQCALALVRARLIASERAARAQAERAADRTARLQKVTATLAAAVTMEDVARAVIRYGLAAAGAVGGVVCRLNEDASAIDRVWGLGYPEESFDEFRRVALSVPLPPREVVQTRAPVFIQTSEEWLAHYLPPQPGMAVAEAAAALPLLVGDRLVGVMHGDIAVESTVTGGSRFTLTLPRHRSATPHDMLGATR